MKLIFGPELRGTPAPLLQALSTPDTLLLWHLDSELPSIYGSGHWLYELIGVPAYTQLVRGEQVEPHFNRDLLAQLRDLAHGLWLHDWWPTSPIDSLPALPQEVLLSELHSRSADLEEIIDLDLHLPETAPTSAQPDFALVAGGSSTPHSDGLASGSSTLAWQSVPRGLFDATEHPISWSIDAAPHPQIHLRVAMLPDPVLDAAGIAVKINLRGHGEVAGALSAEAHAVLDLPITAAEAWSYDFATMGIQVGVACEEEPTVRTAGRRKARESLDNPRYQAEQVVADSLY